MPQTDLILSGSIDIKEQDEQKEADRHKPIRMGAILMPATAQVNLLW